MKMQDVDEVAKAVRDNPGLDYQLTYVPGDSPEGTIFFNLRAKPGCSCRGSMLWLLYEKPVWGRVVLELLKKCPEIKGVKISSFNPPILVYDNIIRSYFDTYLEILRTRKLLYFEVKCERIRESHKILRRIHRAMKKNYSIVHLDAGTYTILDDIGRAQLDRNMSLRKKARHRAMICILCIWKHVWIKNYVWPRDVMKKIVGFCYEDRVCMNVEGHRGPLSFPVSEIYLEEWVDAAIELGKSLYG